ncbi:sporulation integral membrane protein YtvI [Microaerobacter geothermalis]|uniref:sporulation integral membrane protein YtvI n=1 Tax=Microaerobacter geothermalis TaxID=674972 RepID=UPI001F19EC47|nr:sporulation integral membrane protein YtvI [Microaerobacter geothermalis]MCF6094922.1 sporulation integral membrane protein YtvI [Microaerobacter geothermalis]
MTSTWHRWVIPTVIIIITIIITSLVIYTIKFSFPFIFALILAVLFEPIVQFFEKLLVKIKYIKEPRPLAVTLNFLLFLLLSFILFYIIFTKVAIQTIALMERLPEYLSEWGTWTYNFLIQAQIFYQSLPTETLDTINKGISSLVDWGKKTFEWISGFILNLVSALPNTFIGAVVFLIALYLMSLHLPKLKKSFLDLFEKETEKKINHILFDLNHAIIGFVRAQLIISLLIYIITFIGLLILDVKYAFAISFFIVIVDILPILGTGSVIIPWSIYRWIQGESSIAIGLLILYLVLVVFRRIVEPKILGENIGLSALATVISMYLGFKVVGAIGLFIGPSLFILVKAIRRAGFWQKKISL